MVSAPAFRGVFGFILEWIHTCLVYYTMELSFFLIAVVWLSVPLGYRAEIQTLDLPCDMQPGCTKHWTLLHPENDALCKNNFFGRKSFEWKGRHWFVCLAEHMKIFGLENRRNRAKLLTTYSYRYTCVCVGSPWPQQPNCKWRAGENQV